jgi:hypothetical protein
VIYADPRQSIKTNGAGSAMDAGNYLDLIGQDTKERKRRITNED